ncbi:carboxymuconolactone decarboxylase family protein [Reyranella sp.]|jgi:alkylhydroperoxidase family enzyme|uniref:carboxymuconolactone decarboxylase family protein n=1 Tax=Reyranella sp. TaxID=1929291 RepID=UPI002F9581A0
MSRIPYYEVENAAGRHAEFLGKLGTQLNIYRMLAHSENGLKGFARMGNTLLHRCELDPVLRELAILRVGRLSRAAYEVFLHERIAREVGVADEKIAALRDATIESPVFSDHEKAVLRFTDEVVRNVRASDKALKAVEVFLSRGALVELTLAIGYYMMVCRFLETTGVDGEEGQAEWLKTAKL